MDIQTEQLLGTIEVLLEAELICKLPYNHTSEWEPFVWDSEEKCELTIMSLLKSERWIKPTDIETAIQNWQDIEQSGVPTPDGDDHYAEGRFDEDDYQDREAPEFVSRKSSYRQLAEYLKTNFKNLQVYQLSSHCMYSCFAIVGELEDASWICITSTVPQETPEFEDILVPQPQDYSYLNNLLNESNNIVNQIEKLLEPLTPVQTYGFYDGGYEHTYQHQILCKTASTEEEALKKALISSKILDIKHFKTFYPDPEEYIFTDDYSDREEGIEWYNQYQRLNRFLTTNFTQLIMYKFNFWNYTHIFVIGKSSGNDWVGLRLTSEFDYNP